MLLSVIGECGIFTDDETIAMVRTCYADDLLRRRTMAELRGTLADVHWSWQGWLNKVSHFDFASEELARGYADKCIWQPIFDDRMPPPHGGDV